MKSKFLYFAFLLALLLNACEETCSDLQCPANCQYLPFLLLKPGGKSILQGPNGYPRPFIRLTANAQPELPPEFKITNEFSFIACDGVEYTLHLNDTEKIAIIAAFDIYTPSQCCEIKAISSVSFNGIQPCSDFAECANTLEITYP